jgi:hypothetical protein
MSWLQNWTTRWLVSPARLVHTIFGGEHGWTIYTLLKHSTVEASVLAFSLWLQSGARLGGPTKAYGAGC